MLDRILETLLLPGVSIELTVLILLVFFVAGIVKGFLGIGLPAAAMAFFNADYRAQNRYFPDVVADYFYQSDAISSRARTAPDSDGISLFCAGDHDKYFCYFFIYQQLSSRFADRLYRGGYGGVFG